MTAAYIAAFLWGFWGLYVLIMGLYRAQLAGRLTTAMKVLGAPFLLAGYITDIVCNLTVAMLVFAEVPREALVTTRLTRYIKQGAGWRYDAAVWICSNLLDPLDPRGKHCAN